MADFRKLGALPPRRDPRTLRFNRYIQASAIPPAPPSVGWTVKVPSPFRMFLNDRMGCCTCASLAHHIHVWSSNNASEVVLSDDAVLKAYSAISGYDPQTGANDNGAVEIDVLNYYRKVGIAGRKLGAYVAVNPVSLKEIEEAIYLFGGVYVGVALPLGSQSQKVWTLPNRIQQRRPEWQPGSWGGHAIPIVNYDRSKKAFDCITWGERKRMSYDWFVAYCQEAYALLAPEWFNGTKKAPNGYDLITLAADLKEITSMGTNSPYYVNNDIPHPFTA